MTDVLQAFERSLGELHAGHRALGRYDPQHLERLETYYLEGVLERQDAAVPRAVKELVIMAVSAALTMYEGARFHLKRALLAGATPREALEFLETAAIPAGLPVLWQGARLLDEVLSELEQPFEGAPEEGRHG
ncbi:MAG: carboxymuconolactone decarboxylase family protein [Deltaproteobacteria bacterium]|nr:carboxymuconolactone decarboxylase family protein [Deltaproteobacteria bacterium]